MNTSPPFEITVDEEINGTREDSTTQSEDRHLKMINKNGKLNQLLTIGEDEYISPSQLSSKSSAKNAKKGFFQNFFQKDLSNKRKRSST